MTPILKVRRSGGYGGLAIVMLGTALLAGCQAKDKLTYDNFSQIRPNASSQEEVRLLLGDPSHRLGDGMWIYERPDAHLTAMIDFNDHGRVTRKQWIDAEGQVWEDTDPDRRGEPVEERLDVRTEDRRRP